MIGEGNSARWDSAGLPPRLRIVENCSWDARSDHGSDFLYETPLPLDTGPTIELVVIPRPGNRSLLVLRCHHAVIDGTGSAYFLQELFRALRGEPLCGTNAAFSDVDLMLSVGATRSTSRHVRTVAVTGHPQGEERGDVWRCISLGKPGKNFMPRIAGAVASFAHTRTDLPVLIMVPVDLRRHAPGLQSTMCYATALVVRLDKGEGSEEFKRQLHEMIDARMETVYPRILELAKLLPRPWLDRMLSRTESNYRTKKPLETVVISNFRGHQSTEMGCASFRSERMFVIPPKGSAFIAFTSVDGHMELSLNLPRVLASDGRLDAFVEHLYRFMMRDG
jgi:hypothetical protein